MLHQTKRTGCDSSNVFTHGTLPSTEEYLKYVYGIRVEYVLRRTHQNTNAYDLRYPPGKDGASGTVEELGCESHAVDCGMENRKGIMNKMALVFLYNMNTHLHPIRPISRDTGCRTFRTTSEILYQMHQIWRL